MTRKARVYSAVDAVDNAMVAATEEVLLTSPALMGEFPDAQVTLVGHVQVTGAAGLTGVTIRVRRDGLAGALVGEAAVMPVAGAVSSHLNIVVSENRANLGGQRYVLTGEPTGGAATATYMDLTALVS